MDSWWWLAVGAVVVLALVVALSDAFGRSGRPARRRRPPARPGERARGGVRPPRPAGPRPGRPGGRERGGPEPAPRAGEIWWADVPYEDGPGSKDRPCLVLSVRGGTALVAKITSRHHEERPGVIALPAGSVGDARGRASFLETDELREVPVREFRRRVGKADPALWARVRHLAA
ncbi:type II toxin-antitoxin system PemK/MazF family toxin [Streptomyces sp. NPDC005805]|uniref:type II toxin-antitoxin system PemK/MazF family toxin n=1 Tax=Streptomyces sp. NPDC005805 TaxID=3157068 RepID=UPI0033FEC23F